MSYPIRYQLVYINIYIYMSVKSIFNSTKDETNFTVSPVIIL